MEISYDQEVNVSIYAANEAFARYLSYSMPVSWHFISEHECSLSNSLMDTYSNQPIEINEFNRWHSSCGITTEYQF